MELITNSLTPELNKHTEENFDSLEEMEKKVIKISRIALDEMFFMSNSVIWVLHKYRDNFTSNGFSKTYGENSTKTTDQILAVSKRFCEANSFICETPSNVLIRITKCSVPEFKGTFELALKSERLAHALDMLRIKIYLVHRRNF